MKALDQLIDEVARARENFLVLLRDVTVEQAGFKPTPARWSMVEITEHLVHAEDVGVHGIWRALENHRRGEPLWQGENQHAGLSIEEVTGRTWREKEEVPAIAAPREGGSLAFWAASLKARQSALEELAQQLAGIRLEEVIYPHPISGPLDIRQRLEFLRFHLDRHRQQIIELQDDPLYPKAP